MKSDLRQDLLMHLAGSVFFIGLGNESWGDDGFGLKLARTLQERGYPRVALAGTSPERFLTEALKTGCDHLVFLDTVDFGGKPGEVVFLNGSEIQARFPQISTHKISIGWLAQWAEAQGLKTWLLGAQPQSLKPIDDRGERFEMGSRFPAGELTGTPIRQTRCLPHASENALRDSLEITLSLLSDLLSEVIHFQSEVMAS